MSIPAPESMLTERLPNGCSFELIYVEGGGFRMGSEDEEAFEWEKPIHHVELKDFYIGKYPVTQSLWKAVIGEANNPSFFRGDDRPVESISWNDAQEFLQKLGEQTGRAYRLLSEAEWEYAARGGQKSRGFKYAGSNKLKEVGWYDENSYGETRSVGLKRPNELGIYDMSGNVWEWVEDAIGASRVIRGGSWYGDAWGCRVSSRGIGTLAYFIDYVGFRLGLSLQFTL